jgi:hypothetical protein
VKALVDELVQLRTKGISSLEHFVKAHLALNGIDADAYTDTSPDDYNKIRLLEKLIEEYRAERR